MAGIEIENARQFFARQERHLRAGTQVQHAAVIDPADGGVRLQVRLLGALGGIGALVDDVRFGKAGFDVADAAVHLARDIVERIAYARFRPLVVDQRRAVFHRVFRLEHRRQDVVVDLELAAAFFRRRFAVGHNRRDPLADEAHHVVEHQRIVGID